MFIGEYTHNLDQKGRLAVPVKFRTMLTGGAVITRGFDQCLFMYSQKDWETLAGKLVQLPIHQANSRAYARLMLAGAMNVFLDGTFVATSSLRTVMSGEKFDLALGVDDGISIKHKRVNKFTEDTGLTNSGKRVTYEYLITVQNNKKTTERVVVADQVPLSRNEKIVVKLLSPDAKDVKPTDEGTLKWTLDLKPGEKRELTVKFTVEYANDVNVAGLE